MECPKCKQLSFFYPVSGRTAYACKFCGYQIYPLAGTIFEKTTTPLDLWFFAMYLMVQTRSGVSAKQLERMLGVTYKTAWRMFRQIRLLMAQTGMLDGTVEIDETFMGGKGQNRRYEPDFGNEPKEVVMGMVQRNGKAYAKHIPNTGKWTLLKQIKENISPTARLLTDEYYGYTHLKYKGYNHQFVTHRDTYVVGDIHTQNVENLWSIIKRGIYGVYRVVSNKYLQAYIDEFTWRYSNRLHNGMMFEKLLGQISEVKLIQPALTK
jgi:transposase-like protein